MVVNMKKKLNLGKEYNFDIQQNEIPFVLAGTQLLRVSFRYTKLLV